MTEIIDQSKTSMLIEHGSQRRPIRAIS